MCIVLTLAQCASRFSTAGSFHAPRSSYLPNEVILNKRETGGAYHYSCFLVPEKYRRQVAYPLGWLNYFGWIFTHAACCAIVATLIMSLVNLCNPNFVVATRWQLFLLYMAVATTCWAINLRGLKSIPRLELFGCWSTSAHCPFAREEGRGINFLVYGNLEYQYTNLTALRLCYCSGIRCLLRRSSCQGSEGERTIRVCGPEQRDWVYGA